MGVRVLLIEDDQTIAEPLVEGLGHFGLTVQHVRTGHEGLRGPYGDVVLLDLGLPDVDGIDVCRGIRQTSDVPIIILSARGEEADRVLGLELGADDYLAKPFSMRELVARVRAVTRRTQRGLSEREFTGSLPYDPAAAPAAFQPQAAQPPQAPRPPRVPRPPVSPRAHEPAVEAVDAVGAAGPLVVDRRTRQVWVGEEAVTLTPKEFELLALLTEDPGAVYSRQQIIDRVWDPHYQGPTKTLDVHVATLRRKLGHSAWIQTLRGVGFRLAVRTASPPQQEPSHEEPPQQGSSPQYESWSQGPPQYESWSQGPPQHEPWSQEPPHHDADAPPYTPSPYDPPGYSPPPYDPPRHEPAAHHSFSYEPPPPPFQQRPAAYR